MTVTDRSEDPPIKSWSLRNFKSVERGEIQLAPLTVLVGSNSSGKSSLIQSILLFAQASRSWREDGTIPLNGPLVGLGEFDSALHAGSTRSEIEVAGVFSLGGRSRFRRYRTSRLTERYGRSLSHIDEDVEWSVKLIDAAGDGHSGSASVQELELWIGDSLSLQGARSKPSTRKPPAPQGDTPFVSVDGRVSDQEIERSISWLAHKAGLPTELYFSTLSSAVDADRWHRRIAELLAEMRLDEQEGSDQASLLPGEEAHGYLRGTGRTAAEKERRQRLRYLLDMQIEQLDFAQIELAGLPVQDRREILEILELQPGELESLERDFERYRKERRGPRSMREPGLEGPPQLVIADIRLDRLEEILQSPKLSAVLLSFLVHGSGDTEQVPVPLRRFGPSDRILSAASAVLSLFRTEISYLGPLRVEPQAMYRISQTEQADDVGSKGEHTASVLYRLANRVVPNAPLPDGSTRNLGLGRVVNEWLGFFDLASYVTTEDRGKLGLELQISIEDVERTLDITSVGVGLSQVLPVIVRVLLAPPGSVVLLEQPELHLHPALQQRLGEFLLQAAHSGRQVIVETHSDHLISQLRLRVASDTGDETRSLVQLVNVWREQGRTKYQPVNIDEYGGLEGWPPGFLDQGPEAARQILEAGLEKRLRE